MVLTHRDYYEVFKMSWLDPSTGIEAGLTALLEDVNVDAKSLAKSVRDEQKSKISNLFHNMKK